MRITLRFRPASLIPQAVQRIVRSHCLQGLTLLLLVCATSQAAPQADSVHFAAGPAFHRALGHGVSAAWRNGEFRQALQRLCRQQKVAWVLDRRLDPNRSLTAEYNNEPLEGVLQELAGLQEGAAVIVADAVYLGPSASAARLRTLIVLREQELQSSVGASLARRNDLQKRRAEIWDDLETPRELLERVAKEHHLTVSGLELIPHDLWGAGALAEANVCEALSILLIQFDLTFAWNKGATGINIGPIPEKLVLTKTLNAPRGTSAETVRGWVSGIPGLNAQFKGGKILAEGTFEQLEALEHAVNPNERPAVKPRKVEPDPIAKRRFSLTQRDVPVSALLEYLEDSGIIFSYDPEKLKEKKINLGQLIDVNVEQAPPEKFFHAVFDPLKLDFKIDGLTVTLTPKD